MTATALPQVAPRGAASFPGSAGYVPAVRGPEARRLAFQARQVRAALEASASGGPAAALEALASERPAAVREPAPLIIAHPPRVPGSAVVRAEPRPSACTRPVACGSRARAARGRSTSLTAA